MTDSSAVVLATGVHVRSNEVTPQSATACSALKDDLVQEEWFSIKGLEQEFTPRFEAAGEYCCAGYSKDSENVRFAFTVQCQADPSRSITKETKHSFCSEKPSWGYPGVMPWEELKATDSTYLDASKRFCVALQITAQLKEASCGPPPPTSQEGQVLLTLDDGSVLRAHQLYLEHASPLFKASLPSATIKENPSSASCKRPRLASAEEPKLPLPGVTKRQAQLLVHALYSFMRETWASSLQPPELLELARVASRFNFPAVLDLADTVLVAKCAAAANRHAPDAASAWLMVQDAPAQHQLARKLGLAKYEGLVGRYLGRHARDVDLTRLDPSFAAMLQGARLMQK